jgi:uncharacterized phage-associated protein
MFVRFDFDRCMEAAGGLFGTTETKTMGRMRLLKLLYLANRKSLRETGDPIVDDDMYAMKNGPVLSETYNFIKGENWSLTRQSEWDRHFRIVDGILLKMVDDPGTDHLSDYDVETLTVIAHQYRDAEDEDLSELTHTFEEWKKHWDGTKNREAIPEQDLLTGIGYTLDQARELLREASVYAAEQEAIGCR